MKLVIYRTKIGPQSGYRWTLVADNGRKLANGGQGYSRRKDMIHAVEKVLHGWFTVSGTFARAHSGEVVERIPVEDRIR